MILLFFAAIPLDSCGVINKPGEYYLTRDIAIKGVECIQINTSDVLLDCKGFSISGNPQTTIAISAKAVDDIEIRGCMIHDVFIGIDFQEVKKSSIHDNNIYSASKGINLIASPSLKIADNTIHDCSYYALYLDKSSSEVSIEDNWIYGNTYGIYLSSDSGDCLIVDNKIEHNTAAGMEFHAHGCLVYNNLFNNTNNVYGLPTYEANDWNTTKRRLTNIIGGPYVGGNAWCTPSGSGYSDKCVDKDGDQICDDPYKMNSYNVDFLPLALKSVPIIPVMLVDYVPPTPEGHINYRNITVKVSTNRPPDVCTLEIDGRSVPMVVSGNGAEVSLTVDLGEHTFYVECRNANSVGRAQDRTIVVDQRAPEVELISPSNGARLRSPVSLTIRARDDWSDTISCVIHVGGTTRTVDVQNNSRASVSLSLAEGTYRWWAECEDQTGNHNQTGQWAFTVYKSSSHHRERHSLRLKLHDVYIGETEYIQTLDEDNDPVPYVLVKIYKDNVMVQISVSNASGYVVFTPRQIGEYYVAAEKDDYDPATGTFTVHNNAPIVEANISEENDEVRCVGHYEDETDGQLIINLTGPNISIERSFYVRPGDTKEVRATARVGEYVCVVVGTDHYLTSRDSARLTIQPVINESNQSNQNQSLSSPNQTEEYTIRIVRESGNATGEPVILRVFVNHRPQDGIWVRVYDSEGNLIFRGVTNESGAVAFSPEKPGKYKAVANYKGKSSYVAFNINEREKHESKLDPFCLMLIPLILLVPVIYFLRPSEESGEEGENLKNEDETEI